MARQQLLEFVKCNRLDENVIKAFFLILALRLDVCCNDIDWR